jgi:hypothetical protein
VSLPQTNATLTLVEAAGVSEDFDRPAGAGAQKWTGRAGVYLRQREERVTQGDRSSVVISRALIVPASLGIDWSEGDQLTLNRPTRAPETVIVRGVEPFTHPTAVGETRLVLEDG